MFYVLHCIYACEMYVFYALLCVSVICVCCLGVVVFNDKLWRAVALPQGGDAGCFGRVISDSCSYVLRSSPPKLCSIAGHVKSS